MVSLVLRSFGRALIVCIFTFGLVGSLTLVAPALADNGDCGQPISAGPSPVATDALVVLRAAVGAEFCELCICDVDNNGAINATDALRDLGVAVGQPIILDCPSCTTVCGASQAPSCGGTCEGGETCGVHPESPDSCRCLSACEASPSPTCGGSCEPGDPGSTCRALTFHPEGEDPIELCDCLPAGKVICSESSGTGCDGICTTGAECGSDAFGGCTCVFEPVQPTCGSAATPECNGSCGEDTICEFDGIDACSCVAFTGQEQTCFEAGSPTCGGVCGFGEVCATEIGVCECVTPCEVSATPGCGGDCLNSGETCKNITVTLDGAMLDICGCRPAQTVACDVAQAPTCGGDCPQGSSCGEDQGAPGSCVCTPDGGPPACFEAQAPACGGTCNVGESCVQDPGGPFPCGCRPDQPMGCFESQAPSCGGECPEGRTCGVDPEFPDECDCQDPCQASDAPTCGGSCASVEAGTICRNIRITPAGEPSVDICECLPPDLGFCENATGPDCEGFCGPGSLCQSDGGGGCQCMQLPVQPTCDQAPAPDCFGSCGESTICESDGGSGCVCVAFTGQEETCFNAAAPTCGGVCSFSEICANQFDGCDCFERCDVSGAPGCGGSCSDSGDVCKVITLTVDGNSTDICECR